MLEKLGEVLKRATNKIANAIFLDKNLIDNIIRDLQRALIEADVSIFLVKKLTDKIKKTAFDERIKGIDKKEHLIKLLHDDLIQILGKHQEIKLKKDQNRIILLGLYGAGKTTTIAKLGNYFAKRGNKVALIGLDVHRPSASEQLKQLAEQNKLTYFIDKNEKNPIKIYKKYEKKLKNYNLILIDTAGRHTLDKDLIKEIKNLGKTIKPTETILIMPADIGQAAKKQAKEFKEALNISGVIITRMDSSAKGGGALTACAETNAGIYFITDGEKINDIEEFDSEAFLSHLLGIGDLKVLIDKIKLITNEDEQKKIQERLKEGKITLNDVVEQVKSMSSLGGFDKIKNMLPGIGNAKIPKNVLENQETKVAKWEHIIKSMTKEEIENPEILKKQTSRMTRISKGSGVNNSNIRTLLKQYDMLNEMVKNTNNIDMEKGINQKQLQKMLKKFGKMKNMRFK